MIIGQEPVPSLSIDHLVVSIAVSAPARHAARPNDLVWRGEPQREVINTSAFLRGLCDSALRTNN